MAFQVRRYWINDLRITCEKSTNHRRREFIRNVDFADRKSYSYNCYKNDSEKLSRVSEDDPKLNLKF